LKASLFCFRWGSHLSGFCWSSCNSRVQSPTSVHQRYMSAIKITQCKFGSSFFQLQMNISYVIHIVVCNYH